MARYYNFAIYVLYLKYRERKYSFRYKNTCVWYFKRYNYSRVIQTWNINIEQINRNVLRKQHRLYFDV